MALVIVCRAPIADILQEFTRKAAKSPLWSFGHWRLERQLSEVEPPFIVLQRPAAYRPKLTLEI